MFETLVSGVSTETGSQICGVGDFMRIELDKEIIDVRYLEKEAVKISKIKFEYKPSGH